MKTLLEQSQELCGDIDRIANQENDAQIAQSLITVAEAVGNHVVRARSLGVSVHAMVGQGMLEGPWFSDSGVGSLQKRIEALRKRLDENRSDLRKGNTWANCDTDAGSLAKTLGGNLEAAWRRFIDGQITDTASFSTFRQVPACKIALKKVDELNATQRTRSLSLPTTRKEISEVVAIGKEGKELIAKMKLSGVPRAVETLLKSAATGGAPLVDLSDEVLKWLREHEDFLAGLRITASSQ